MTELIAARDRLAVYRLPPYAHELNPVALVWSHLKRSLAGLAKCNLPELTALVKTWLKRMQYRPDARTPTQNTPRRVRDPPQRVPPHRSRQFRPPRPDHPPADLNQQRIKRRPVLGGLINEYERAA